MRLSSAALLAIATLVAAPAPSVARNASPTAVPAPTATRCTASVVAARVAPGRYAVATLVTESLDEVDIRVDGPAGHWVYKTTEPHALLAVPDLADAIGVEVVGTRFGEDPPATCAMFGRIATGPEAAPLLAAISPSTPPLLPFSSGVDAPAACEHPFVAAATLQAARPMMPSRAEPGIVKVQVDLDEHSAITDAKIWSSTNPSLNANALATTRASTFQTEIFRCKPLKQAYLFTVWYETRSP